MTKAISTEQMKRLQTLYSKFEQGAWGSRGQDQRRRDRLDWARINIGREIASFSQLTGSEANSLIDVLQVATGQRPSREVAQQLGARGRRGEAVRGGVLETMPSAAEIDRIQEQLTRLGWDQARLDRFLASPSSPLKGRSQVRTLRDARKVYFALKRMANSAAPARAGVHGA